MGFLQQKKTSTVVPYAFPAILWKIRKCTKWRVPRGVENFLQRAAVIHTAPKVLKLPLL